MFNFFGTRQKPKVFVREATGLVREFGSWDSFAFNLGGIVTVVALSALFASFNFLLGANIMVSLLIFLPILLACKRIPHHLP